MKHFNKRTDCWRCNRTFKPPDPQSSFSHIPFYIPFNTVLAYNEDDILCTDCIDEEITKEKEQ